MGLREEYNKKKKQALSDSGLSSGSLRKEYELAKKYGKFDVNQDTINSFINDANSFLSSAEEDYGGLGWGNASDVYSARSSKSSELGYKSSAIRRWLDSQKDGLDEETYKSLTSTLDGIDSGVSTITNTFKSAVDYFSKFKSEDEYNEAVKKHQDYTASLEFDLEAGQAEIDGLKANRAEIDSLYAELERLAQFPTTQGQKYGNYTAPAANGGILAPGLQEKELANRTARVNEINARLAELGSAEDLDATIAEKDRYLSEARRLQEWYALGAVGDPDSEHYDPNFEAFSLAGADTPYTDFGKKTLHNAGRGVSASSIDKYRAAVVALYEHEGNATPNGYDKYSLIDKYRGMDDTEFAVFAYYLEKDQREGTNLAEQYIDSIEESLNRREAEDRFANLEGKWALELLFGVEAGLDQFASGVENLFSQKDYIPATSTQMTSQLVREDLGESGFKIWGNTIGQTAYDAITTTSNMLPSILASTAVGLVAPGVGQVVGAGLLSASAAGNGYAEMLNLGYTKEQARSYAALVGASEGVLQYIIGGIGALGGKVSGNALKKVVSKLDNAFARVAISIGGEMASEAFEEGFQTVLEAWFKSEVTGMDFEAPNIDEVLYSSLLGALSAAGIGGVTTVGGEALSNYKANTKYGGAAQDLINEAREIGTEDALYFAKKYQGLLDEGKTLTGAQLSRLIESNQKGIPESDINKIADAAEARLTELGETGDVMTIASALAKQVAGQKLSFIERNALSNSRYGKRVANELNRNNVKSGQYTSDWVKDIGTYAINDDIYNLAEEVAGVSGLEGRYTVRNGEIVSKGIPMAKYDAKKGTVSFPSQNAQANAKAEGAAKNTPAKQNETERVFEASDNGKTIYNGEEVTVKEIASVKDGKITLRLDNGATVNASDVSFGSNDEAIVYEMVSRMGVGAETANELVAGFTNGNTTAAMYAVDIPLAYQYGKWGFEKGLAELNIPEAQKRIAYNRGRIDAMTDANDRANAPAVLKAPSAKTKKNGIIYEGFDYDTKTATDIQRASIKGIETIAKLSPTLEFHVYRSELKNGKRVAYIDGELVKAAPNGYFTEGNKIYIDLNAGANGQGAMLYTVSHEIGHYIRQWNAKGFKVLGDFLLEQYGKNDVPVYALIKRQEAKIKNRLKKEGKPIPNAAKLYDMAYEEMVCDAMSTMFADPKAYEKLADLKMKNPGVFKKLGEAIKKILDKLKSLLGIYSEETPDALEAQYVMEFAPEVYEKLQDLYLKAFVKAEANYESALNSGEIQTLSEAGIGIDEETNTAYSIRFTTADGATVKVGKKEFDTEAIAQLVARGTGRSIADARRWVNSELAIANIVMTNPEFLDFEADERYEAIKKNSDYPQGTVDLSNLCPKRAEFTTMFDMLQRKYPDKLFTASDVAEMRGILSKHNITVACGACFVEDRRQLLGEIADTYIGMWKEAVETGKGLHKENAKGEKVELFVTADLAKRYGLTKGSKILATDTYIPTQYDLTTYEGFKLLEKNHPTIAMGFNRYNNSRGQQSGRLIEGRAEYNRQILGWSDAKVRSVNNNGGLRIFSFSDFEVVHLLDLVQVIIDCAAKGVKIQGYTKIPAFAKLVRNTGIKLNRSFIPKGETGIKIVNGKKVLDIDTVEGIDINDENFLDESENPDVGNVIIGINAEQIGIAFLDPNIDYVIPFHSNKAKAILKKLGLATWENYKESQHEKDIATGKASKHNVNIYTQVINKYHPTNKVEFVNAFLKECKAQGKIPRYSEFLNIDENGDFAYREGYHKLLVDFKMFDKEGNILPQGEITPELDNEFMANLLASEVDKKANYEFPKAVYAEIDEKFGDTKFSDRDSEGNELSAEQQEFFKDSKVRDKKGNLLVMYHGTTATFNTFKKGDIGFHFGTKGAARGRVGFGKNVTIKEVYLNITNPIVFDEDLGSWDADFRLTRELYDRGVLTQAEAESVLFTDDRRYRRTTEAANKKLASLLLEKGYDGIAYTNTFESKKATTSYIVFNSNQAKLTTNKTPTSDPDIRYSDRDSTDTATNFLSHMNGIVKTRGHWYLEDVYDYVADHPELNFIERIYAKDKDVKEDIEAFLSGISDTVILRDLYLYMEYAYMPKGETYDENYTIVHPYRGSVRAFQNAIKKRINEIGAEKVGGTNLGIKNGEVAIDDIEDLFNRLNSNGELADFAKKVFSTVRTLGVNIRFSNQMMNQKKGKVIFGQAWGDMVQYKTSYFNDAAYSDQRKAGTLLHELIHTCTQYVMRMNVTAGDVNWSGRSDDYNRIANAATRLNRIYGQIVGDPDFEGQYGLKNPREMVAELANEDFVGLLKKKSLWQEIVDWICELFGFSRGTSAYDNARMCVDLIIDNPDVSAYKEYAIGQRSAAHREGKQYFGSTIDADGIVHYSERDSDSISTRSLLANALDSVAQKDIERQKLAQYKQKISLIEAEQAKLSEIRLKIRELSFAKGPKDTAQIRSLQFEEKQTANRINTYDRQLLNLQATTALKNVLEREKKLAYEKAKKEGKEALANYREKAAATQRELITRWQDSRKQAVEGRNKTAMRHKIKDIAKELDTLLRKPTSKKHIKEELRKAVAEALLAINMDTVGADERVAKYDALIAKAKDPDIIAELTATRDRIQLQGENLKEKLDALRLAYERIKNSKDIELSLSYQEVIRNSIEAVSQKVGNTSIRDMTLEQLEMVYDLYSMIRKTIRDANKAFKAKKGETIMQMAEAVNDQVRTVGGERSKRLAFFVALNRLGWKLLKPLVAFRTIGSDTLTELYTNLQEGEGTFFGDVSEAQAFIEEQYKKHGFKSWDTKETKTFTAKSGKSFELTLEQIMSLYAYSRREKAHAHIIEGGIVFEDAVTVEKKFGIPIKYEVTTKDAFNLSEETLSEIVSSLTEEQKAFVEEMQAYLSDTMGAKGNEVSMEMLGVKLFKEKFYLPIKSSQYYLNFSTEEAGEIKLKNPAFSKETVPHANNPIVLHNFTDLWAEHVNNMSMYHSFVLALEDFTRVYNYKTRTDANVETMSTKKTIETAYPGATRYISDFLKSLNGGVRMDTVGFAEKLTSLAKKGAVLGSASVAIQQPSAVMRAMAVINPLYFATSAPKSINLLKHKQDWAELKKYAPIAGIKEMGRFDVGMGKDTVDWIKANGNVIAKVDDILGLGPAFMDEVTWVAIWNAVKRETIHKHKNLSPRSEQFLKIAGDRFTYVVSLTQVYDSVFSRSDIMRNKSWIAKALTAFMAEPTTTLNMLWDAYLQGKRTGSVKGFVKTTSVTTGAVVASLALNAALKSIIMAMRDDDEDESYVEKYVEHFFADFKDSLNPLNLIPVAKDVVSIFKGYDVERMDMALFSDLKNAVDAFNSDTKTDYEKWSGLIGAISAFFGLPVKNVERDIRGLITTVFGDSEETTAAGMVNAMVEGWKGEQKSNAQQLYEAMLNGDKEHAKRLEGRFKNQDAINTAIRNIIREKYEDGELSAKEAKSQLAKYGDMSADEAASRVQYWDFKQEYPDYDDLSESAVAKYYSDVKPSGISIEVYYDYIEKRSECKGTDSDGDGKTDSGSLKREILKVINSLPISARQKDALYFLNGWSESTLYEAPWR